MKNPPHLITQAESDSGVQKPKEQEKVAKVLEYGKELVLPIGNR